MDLAQLQSHIREGAVLIATAKIADRAREPTTPTNLDEVKEEIEERFTMEDYLATFEAAKIIFERSERKRLGEAVEPMGGWDVIDRARKAVA